jgi:tRNA(Ile)-lysidine synthetase-like protein
VGAVLPPALGRYRVVARAATVSDDAVVRSAAEGERIDIETGTKPVREAMAEAGVPVRLRSAWPVVAVGGKIAWVAGARIAEWARIALLEEPAVALSMEGNGA